MHGKETNYRRAGRPSLAARPGRAAVSGIAALAAALLAAAAVTPAAHAARASDAAPATISQRWTHIAVGWYSTCGIREGNTLWCWGSGQYGALGDHRKSPARQPQQVAPPTTGWNSVTVGLSDGCATRNNGSLWCWGNDRSGQLGVGTAPSGARPHQVTTPSAAGWVSASAGLDDTCAIRADSTLWCWGANDNGQLGTGTTAGSDLPQQVTSPAAAGWTSVTAGWQEDTCATRSDGTLWCWGYNGNGQLGIGNTTDEELPQQVTTPAADGWTAVSTGGYHTCATRDDSTMWCWGSKLNGQLGMGNTTSSDRPRQVTTPASTGWSGVSAGLEYTCATRDHTLWCWGFNNNGQLGDGGRLVQARPGPVAVPARTGWNQVAAGNYSTCAIRTGHTLWCWGAFLGDVPRQVTS